jgi:hypothetical protein
MIRESATEVSVKNLYRFLLYVYVHLRIEEYLLGEILFGSIRFFLQTKQKNFP